MDDAVELADLLWKLRSELTRAMLGGDGKDLRFRADSVELELTVAVEKVRDPAVKVRFWVVDASVGGKHTSASTQTLRLKMQPVRGDDPTASALIGGRAESDED